MEGISELKDVVLFVAKLGNGIASSLEDGSVGVADAVKLLPAMAALFPALSGIEQLPAELKDLDEAEQKEIIDLFKANLEVENDNVEQYAELGFEVSVKLAKFIVSLKK